MDFQTAFSGQKPVIGMVHLKALPGAPGYGGSIEEIYRAAAEDLHTLEREGVDAAIVENFGDVPYRTENELITLTAMTALAVRLRAESGLRLGLNVQFNCTEAEWDIAYAAGYDFIRVEALVENRVGVHGITMAAAPELLRLKGRYPAETMIFADVNVKHTYPLAEQPLDFSIREAGEAGAAAVIVTGVATGRNPSLEDVRRCKELAGPVPVLLGSGISSDNAPAYFELADGAIVGSSFKHGGNVWAAVDGARVRRFLEVLGRRDR